MAVALSGDELFVEYKPIWWVENGQLVAVEATVRRDHPDLGEIEIDQLLGPAANSGLSVRLGKGQLGNCSRYELCCGGSLPDCCGIGCWWAVG